MKVNIITAQEQSKQGYTNVTLTPDGLKGIPDSACNELMVDNVLEFAPENVGEALVKKVRNGGVMEIRSPDAQEVMRQYQLGSVSFEEASILLAGGRARISTLDQTRSFLESNGLHVEFAGLNGAYYRITAKRPQ